MLITVEPLHDGHLGGRIFANNLFAGTIFIVDCRKKKKKKKKREKASKLSKNRTGDNCMSFGNIEKELALLALKSSQSRALK